MSTTTKSTIALAALAAVAALAVASVMPPSPRASDAAKEEFSAGRAFAHVEQVGKTSHVTGSPANDSVRDYLVTTLRGMGLEPQVQDTIGLEGASLSADGRAVAAARVRNVVTVIPGERSTGRVILMAHYDSVQTGPGANDDGAGVSSLLETTRALLAGPRLQNDVVLLLTDAEEACLCGAEAFVEQHELAKDGGVVLNVEARGSAGPAIMFETSAGNADLVRVFGAKAPHPVGTSVAVEVYRILPNDTDFTPFRLSGRFTGLNSAYIDGSAAYHSPQDTADRMDKSSLQHHGDNLLALTKAFGAADLTDLKQPNGPDASYFPVFKWLLLYSGSWVWPLAILALLAVAAFGWLAVRKGQTGWGRVAAGTGLALIPIIVVPVAAQLVWLLLTIVRPGYANMIDPWRPIWYRWAVVALVAVILLVWAGLARRRLDATSLTVGAFVWLAVLGVLLATAVPGGSYLTALPALCGAVAGIAALYLTGWARVLVLTAGAAVAVVILAPVVTLFFPALGLATAAAPALFAILLGLALLPIGQGLPALGWSIRSLALLTVILLGVGLMVDRFDQRHPIPSHLMYALDTDTGKALWASSEDKPGEWTGQYVSKQEDVEATFPLLRDVWTGPADVASLPAPQVRATDDVTSGEVRQLSLKVQPQRFVRLIYLQIDGGVRSASVEGRDIPVRDGHLELLFHAPPADGLDLVITAKVGQQLKVRVMDGSDGLEALPGFKARPANVSVAGSHSSELVLVAKTYPL